MKIQTKRKIVIVALIALTAFCALRYWPSNFDETIDCITYSHGETSYDHVTVRIMGTKYLHMFKQDYISYAMYIDDVRYPREEQLLLPFEENISYFHDESVVDLEPIDQIETFLFTNTKYYRLHLDYQFWLNSINSLGGIHRNYGSVFFNDHRKQIVMAIYEPEESETIKWHSPDSYKMIVSGNNMTEAFETLKAFGIPSGKNNN